MNISLIAAMASNRVIGIDGQLPWRLPAELAHFKRVTLGKPVLMGRKTFESLGKPLPQRLNIVLSRQRDFAAEGVIVVHTIEEAIAAAVRSEAGQELMVIGGANIYEQFLPLATTMYLTKVEASVEGDAFFPTFSDHEWQLTEQCLVEKDERNAFNFVIQTYTKVSS